MRILVKKLLKIRTLVKNIENAVEKRRRPRTRTDLRQRAQRHQSEPLPPLPSRAPVNFRLRARPNLHSPGNPSRPSAASWPRPRPSPLQASCRSLCAWAAEMASSSASSRQQVTITLGRSGQVSRSYHHSPLRICHRSGY